MASIRALSTLSCVVAMLLVAPVARATTAASDVTLDLSYLDLTANNVQDAFEELPGRVFNVLDDAFAGGAVPDDAGDDSDAFEAAIAAADDFGCGTVFVPPGVYDLGSFTAVAIEDCVRIVGAGPNASILDGDDTTAQMIKPTQAGGGSPPAIRFWMEKIQVRNWNATLFAKQIGADVDGLVVRDCIFDNVRALSNVGEIFTHTTETQGTTRFDNVLMEGNLLRNGSNGLLHISNPDFSSIIVRANTYIDGIGFNFVSVGDASNPDQSGVVLVGNVVKNLYVSGSPGPQIAVFGGKTRGLVAIGNVVENVQAEGSLGDGVFHWQGASAGNPGEIVIANNVILDYSMPASGSEGAISLKGEASRVIVANNVIRTRSPAARGKGITLFVGPVMVVGNYLERLSGGIAMNDGFEGAVVAGNTLRDIDLEGTGDGNAISVLAGGDAQIIDNVIVGVTKSAPIFGIQVQADGTDVENVRIAGNLIVDVTPSAGNGYGVQLGIGDPLAGVVIENNMMDKVDYGISVAEADTYSGVYIRGNVYRELRDGRYKYLERLLAPVSVHDELEQTCQRFDSPTGLTDQPVLLGFDHSQRVVAFRCAAFGGGSIGVALSSPSATESTETCTGTPAEVLINHDLDAGDVLVADFVSPSGTVDSAMVCVSY